MDRKYIGILDGEEIVVSEHFMMCYALVWEHCVRKGYKWNEIGNDHVIIFKKRWGRGYQIYKTIGEL